MARRGTVKRYSVEQEEYIARIYEGVRSKSSGAAGHDSGDVRCPVSLIECKYKGSPAKPMKNKPKILSEFEKIAKEAYAEGRDPLMALRYYAPDSPIADLDGWVDFSVRLVQDDREREKIYVQALGPEEKAAYLRRAIDDQAR